MMRVVITGGRDYQDRETVYAVLDDVRPDAVGHGGAPGADSLAQQWCVDRQVPRMVFMANWKDGRSAGPARNRWMLDEFQPDMVIAFPGGRGTANCVNEARKRGISVRMVEAAP